MSANIRATPPPSCSGRHGSRRKVLGSGIAIMSDSSIALKPVMEEPSKPLPASKAPSRSCELIENDFSWPRMSVNHMRMKRTPVSRTLARTSSAVVGCSSVSAMEARTLQPAERPRAQLAQGRGELAAHVRQPVLDAGGRAVADVALDDAAGLELLHAFGQQPVGEVRHGAADLREAHRAAVEQDVDDRARPALADELDRLVQVGTAGARALQRRDRDLAAGDALTAHDSGRAQDARILHGAVGRDVAGDVDHGGEGLERHHGDRLEQLLVGPAGLARLLEQVAGALALLGERAQIAQQRRLARVPGVSLAGEGELVEAQTRLPARAGVEGQS